MMFVRALFFIALKAAPLLAAPTLVLDEGGKIYIGGEEDGTLEVLKGLSDDGGEIKHIDLSTKSIDQIAAEQGFKVKFLETDEVNNITVMRIERRYWADHVMKFSLFIRDAMR